MQNKEETLKQQRDLNFLDNFISINFKAPLNKTAFLFLKEIAILSNNKDLLSFCNLVLNKNNFIAFNKQSNVLNMLCPYHNDVHWGSVYIKNGSCICYVCTSVFNFYDFITLKPINKVYEVLQTTNLTQIEEIINKNKSIFLKNDTFSSLFYVSKIKNFKLRYDFLNTLKVISNLTNNEDNFNTTFEFFKKRGFDNKDFIRQISAFNFVGGYDDIKKLFLNSYTELKNKKELIGLKDDVSNNTSNNTSNLYNFSFEDFLKICYLFDILNDDKNNKNYRKNVLYNRIIIPLKNDKNEIVNLDARVSSKTPYLTKYLFLKQTTTNNTLNEVLKDVHANNSNLIGLIENNPNKNDHLLFLNEGIFDTLSLQYLGLNAGCVFSANITNHQLKHIFNLSQNYKIILAFDNDEAGIVGILNACKSLVLNGICNPNIILAPRKYMNQDTKDWNDILKINNRLDFEEYYKEDTKDDSLFNLIDSYLKTQFKTLHFVPYFNFVVCLLLLKSAYLQNNKNNNFLAPSFLLSNYFKNYQKEDFNVILNDFYASILFLDVVSSNEDVFNNLNFLKEIKKQKWINKIENEDVKQRLLFVLDPKNFMVLLSKNLINNYNDFLKQNKFLHKFNNKRFGFDANQDKFFRISFKSMKLKKIKKD